MVLAAATPPLRQPALFHPCLVFGYRNLSRCLAALRDSSGTAVDVAKRAETEGVKRVMLLSGNSMSGVIGKQNLYSNHTVSYSDLS